MITVNNLKFSYGNNTVLNNITMTLEPGHIYGLLGENGVGKTTLLTLLSGLKKEQEGSILIEGIAPYKRLPSTLADIFYLPDEVVAVNDKAVNFAKSSGSLRPNFSLEEFLAIMKEFETNPEQKMTTMSAGQLKKTYISFALACRCSYIFLDEPTNGLDIPSKAQFRKAIMTHTREDSTIVISTHQVRDLENIIDPIIILDKQSVLLNATLEEIGNKLYFDYGTTLQSDSLYSEQTPAGFIQVRPNTEGLESKINVEALFNTIHNHKDLFAK
ncbi:MAG: ATP-binding cassette domain-containing protein [Bacteroidales bacterium]|nr:ATP-binding cassette domain-containing protein [Bacteroidales bacterium]